MPDIAVGVPSVFVNGNGLSVTWDGTNVATGTNGLAFTLLPTMTITEAAPEQAAEDGARWSGPVAFEGEMTGDGRIFAPGAIGWLADSLPWPFRWTPEDHGGHDGAVVVGRVDAIFRDESSPGVIFASGVVFTGEAAPPEAAAYLDLLGRGAAGGVSVDGDMAEFSVVERTGASGEITGLELHFTQMRLRTMTAVDIPAFVGARIALTDSSPEASLIASCGCDEEERPAQLASTAPWNGAASRFTDAQYRSAAAGCDPGDAPPKTRCFLPHHEPGGALNINGLHAAAQRISALKGHSPEAVSSAKAHLRRHYGEVDEDAPDSIKASDGDVIVAAAIPLSPPLAWFETRLSEPTPFTVEPDGRVYGHLALWGTCHIAQPNGCITPPKGATYAYFHTGEVCAADGEPVAVGHLTFDTGHAAMSDNALAAASHYDHTGTVAADVRAGEDEFGIWVAGALRPTLSDEQIRTFRAAPLSGDWRRIGGRLELVAALAVNTPGFPVPRTRARVLVASGLQQAVIATVPSSDFDPATDEERAVAKQQIANRFRKSELRHRLVRK